jgi:hypothetical protein
MRVQVGDRGALLDIVRIAGETRVVRVLTVALAAMIVASGCANVHTPPAGVSQQIRAKCTLDRERCLDDCMPNPVWAVIPVLGWIYVPGREYLCQSHCESIQEDCWYAPPDPVALD